MVAPAATVAEPVTHHEGGARVAVTDAYTAQLNAPLTISVPPSGADPDGSSVQPRSQGGSPTKLLPPKTPAPHHPDAATPLPAASSPSALTKALRLAPASHVPLGLARVESSTTEEDSSDESAMQEDEHVLLFNAPAVGRTALDPQLLVRSPQSSLESEQGVLLGMGSLAGSHTLPPHSSSSSNEGQPELSHSAAHSVQLCAAGDGDADGQATPRRVPSALGSLELLAASPESGVSLADLLQGPVRLAPASPALRSAFLPDDDSVIGGLSPLHISGLREPAPLPPPPPQQLPQPGMETGAPPAQRGPAPRPGMPPRAPSARPPARTLPSLPSLLPLHALMQHQHQPGPLIRPNGPPGPPAVPFGHPRPASKPSKGGAARPMGAQVAPLPLRPTFAAAPRAASPIGAAPAKPSAAQEDDQFLTVEGMRLVAAAPCGLAAEADKQLGAPVASDAALQRKWPGTAVAVRAAAAIPSPAAPSVYAALKAEPAALAAGQPGKDPLRSSAFRTFLALLRSDSTAFEAEGRVLRLPQLLKPNVGPQVLDAVLEALECNSRVQALYIHTFEQGMLDAQLDRLVRLLGRGCIWALNVGENFGISRQAWERFADALPGTAVAHLYVSERHLAGTDLKERMRDAIRANRRAAPPRDPEVIVRVGNMWFNPRLPPSAHLARPAAAAVSAQAAPQADVVAATPLPGDKAASPESLSGSGHASGSGEVVSVGGCGAGGAGSAAASASAAAPAAGPASEQPGQPVASTAGAQLPCPSTAPPAGGNGEEGAGQPGRSPRSAPKRRQEATEAPDSPSPPAKRGPGAPSLDARATRPAAPESKEPSGTALAGASAQPQPCEEEEAGSGRGGRARRAARASAAALLLRQDSAFSSDDEEAELDEAYMEGADDDDAYLPFKTSALPIARGPQAAPTRASRRLQRRAVSTYQGHLPMDDEFVTFDPAEEPPSPQRAAPRRRAPPSTAPPPPPATAPAPRSQPRRQERAGTSAALPRAAAGFAKRSVASAAARLRSTGRQASGDLKGRPSFAELLEAGFMQPGHQRFTVGMQDITATLDADGCIRYNGTRISSISKFALVVLRERNPARQSCDGWKEVAWNGEKLDALRTRLQSLQRRGTTRKAGVTAAALRDDE